MPSLAQRDMNIQIFENNYYPKVEYSVTFGIFNTQKIFQIDYCKPKYLKHFIKLKKKLGFEIEN